MVGDFNISVETNFDYRYELNKKSNAFHFTLSLFLTNRVNLLIIFGDTYNTHYQSIAGIATHVIILRK